MTNEEMLGRVCAHAGLEVRYEEAQGGVMCLLSGMCPDGKDTFRFKTLPEPSKAAAAGAALAYVLADFGRGGVGDFVPAAKIASSREELRLKLETLTP